MRRIRRRKFPLSSEKNAEHLARRLVRTLRKKIDAVYVKNILRDPDKPHKDIHGLLVDKEIYLGKRRHKKTRSPLVSTLIHELLHGTFPSMHENTVRSIEKKLYKRLIEAEKDQLKKYIHILSSQIPKHVVKHSPPE